MSRYFRFAPLLSRMILTAGVIGLLGLVACGTPPAERQGLILARSVFVDGPSPATFMVLRPSDDGWTRLEASVPADRVVVQPGTGPDGSTYLRRLGPDDEPASGPLTFMDEGGRWTLAEALDVDPETIEWSLDEEKNGKATTKSYELAGGNVFHKCMWFDPVHGEPGILTISANMPYLKIWRESDGQLASETLWTGLVGGKEHRLRDVEVGDVDGDGQDELVIATHDAGAVFVLEQTAAGFEATEVHRTATRTFVHEVEIGDVDGDGLLEFFTTPSEPNRLDGASQGGGIDLYRWDAAAGSYARTEVAHFPERHAKEILVADLDGDGRDDLAAALEAEGMSDPDARVIVRTWSWVDGALAEAGDIPLEGKMCRFLNVGDTDGDGAPEIIASTRSAGIFTAERHGNEWVTSNVVPGYTSGGFEHATVALDWDGDGRDELIVASDKQKKVRRFWQVDGAEAFEYEDIVDFEGESYFVWNVMPLPAGS